MDIHKFNSRKRFLLLTLLFCLTPLQALENNELPELGDGLSAIVSPAQERALGFLWLSQFRGQVKWTFDPESQYYLESLTANLAGHSRLKDPSLTMIIVPNKTLNAFAVPGGVVGVHSGLFYHAQAEDEFAAVMAHELAHLSQRHFARNVEQAKNSQLPTMAGLLAGLVLAATTGADAGLAMITATQAAGLQSQLRYSRSYEQEADRVGMDTMVAAGHSVNGVGKMFERMQRITRLSGSQIPEFLLTHPLSEQRVADARSRARQFEDKPIGDSFDYQLIRAKMLYLDASSPYAAEQNLKSRLDSTQTQHKDAIRYALAHTLIDMKKLDKAKKLSSDLIEKYPKQRLIKMLDARLKIADKDYKSAANIIDKLLELTPEYYPASYLKVLMLEQQGKLEEAAYLLNLICFERNTDPDLWLLNSNIHGKLGKTLELHSYRAEYHLLTGDINEAVKQLQLALRLAKGHFQQQSKIENRLQQFIGLRERLSRG